MEELRRLMKEQRLADEAAAAAAAAGGDAGVEESTNDKKEEAPALDPNTNNESEPKTKESEDIPKKNTSTQPEKSEPTEPVKRSQSKSPGAASAASAPPELAMTRVGGDKMPSPPPRVGGGGSDAGHSSASRGSGRSRGGTGSAFTPVPPPLRFELEGDDVPTRRDLRVWCKASSDEHDFLQRRVQRLRQEEAAALKKLRETEERSNTLERQKMAHTARRAEHARHRENVLRTQHRERTLVSLARQRESRALVASKTLVQLEKKERVMSARRDHAVHELIVLSQQEARRERLRSQKSAIKEAQTQWKGDRGQEMAMQRKERYRSDLENLMKEREVNVQSSAKLVTQEAAMMLRLHAIKQKNAAALSKLSSIVGTPSERTNGEGEGEEDGEEEEGVKLPPL